MRGSVVTVPCAVCALAIGIPATLGLAADDQAPRPLSQVPKLERFGQAALDAQAERIRGMSATEVRFGDNGAVSRVVGRTGIVLPSGMAGFAVGEPAQELLQKIGPLLLSAGTEELRPFKINREAVAADPTERQSSPERIIKLRQYIRGREVLGGSVNIAINQQTNEITEVAANFPPDRGLEHEPKLTATEVKAAVETAQRPKEFASTQKIVFGDAPARLAYAFEEIGDNGGIGGLLVWVLKVSRPASPDVFEASISAATGQVIRLQKVTRGIGKQRWSYTAAYGSPNPATQGPPTMHLSSGSTDTRGTTPTESSGW